MPSSEMTQSELVRAMVEVGTLLTGPKPFAERMVGMCAAAAYVLQCGQVAVMALEGQHYRGVSQFGLPPELEVEFERYEVDRDNPIVAEIEACDTYLLLKGPQAYPALSRLAEATGVTSTVIVPFTHPDGEALGFVAAIYSEDKREVTVDEAELTMGMARIVQTSVLRHVETQRRQEVSQAMLQVADSERSRLSRDIHDDPLQRILGVRVGLEGLRERLDDNHLRSELELLITQCREASSSLREVMLRTHPNASEMIDLEQVLHAMVNRGEVGSAVELSFSDERSIESPSYLVPALNRIAEQAARNAIRHANACQLRVMVHDHNQGTLLEIEDDGSGFDPSAVDRTRLGLVSMRERTELLGGTFTIDSSVGSGTRIAAWFPHE